MSNINIKDLRHPKEKIYRLWIIGMAILIWATIPSLILKALIKLNPDNLFSLIVTLIFVLGFYIAFFFIINIIIQCIWKAQIFNNNILLSSNQHVDIYNKVEDYSKVLNLKSTPSTFIINGGGIVNAFAAHVLRTRYVFILSDLADLYLSNKKEQELNFVIGHELAHHALGHTHPLWHFIRQSCNPIFLFYLSIFMLYMAVIAAASLAIPLIGTILLAGGFLFIMSLVSGLLQNAYSRACELSCDRIGKALINDDINSSQNALIAITNGAETLYATTNTQEFIKQADLTNPVFSFLYEIFSGYPLMTKRIKALEEKIY